MGFDISFYRFIDDASKFDQMEKLQEAEDFPLDADQLQELQGVAQAIFNKFPGSTLPAFDQAYEQGISVTLPLQTIPAGSLEVLMGYRYAYIADWHPDTSDPVPLKALIELMAALESLGYEAFDPQLGRFVNSANYHW